MVDFKLYLITDRKIFSDKISFYTGVEEALKGGVKAIQLREKDLEVKALLEMAYRMRDITKHYGANLFINERVDVALAINADGVHLGASGIPVCAARKIAGDRLIIGASTHGIEEARKAEQDGADFITLGPIYETASKMRYGKPLGKDILNRIREEISIPVYAIGGIRTDRIAEVIKQGADGIALISDILASDNIKTKSEEFMRLMK